MQGSVTLSVTEAELVAGTECAQDMMYTMRLLESIGLKVKKPMILQMDNKGAIDLCNNWSTSGRTRHVQIRYYWLRELKEAGVIEPKWIPSDQNPSDMNTKSLDEKTFLKHAFVFCEDLDETELN